jgi:segregation and condensation protein A
MTSEPHSGSNEASEERSDPRDSEERERERPDGGTEVFTGSGTGADETSTADPDDIEGAPTPGVDGDGDDPGPDEGVEGASVEPVEVLVGLAEDGEIDPWDIDIVAVTDKFLERLDEGDLRTSGRALFYASVLLRMKSDAMLEADDEPDEEPWDEPWEQGVGEPSEEPDPFAALEQEMDRRLERKRARGMPRTLDELVRDLREAERDSWWKESREYDTADSPSGFERGTQELDYRRGDDRRMDDEPTAADVTDRVHDEHMDETVEEVHAAVRDHYERGRDEVLYREVATAGGSRVQTFLGLLFLAHRGQVRLQQDDLFGDLWIRDPSADAGPGEAVAD